MINKISFTPFPTLSTSRLVLRKLDINDAQEVYFLRSNAQVNQYVKRPTPKIISDAKDFITEINKGISEDQNIYWVINLKDNPLMIGSISLWHFSSDYFIGEVGYDLHPRHHGKGLMTEALKAVLTYAFTRLGLKEIEAYTQYNNLASVKLLEDHGFKLLPEKKDSGNIDNVVYSLLNDKLV